MVAVLFAVVKIAVESLFSAKAVIPAVGGVFGVALKVFKTLYGVSTSAAGSVSARDIGHILIMAVGYFGTALSVSSLVLGDVASGLAWLAAGLASLVTAAHKWAGAAQSTGPAKQTTA